MEASVLAISILICSVNLSLSERTRRVLCAQSSIGAKLTHTACVYAAFIHVCIYTGYVCIYIG
jgi:hypothetical protein